MKIQTIQAFIDRVASLSNISDAYDVYEFEVTDALRDQINNFADEDSPESFRSAMYNLGFKNY